MVVLTFFHGQLHLKDQLSNNNFLYYLWFVFFASQRIQGHQVSNSLSMFGQSIASGIDADNNGYQGELNNFIHFSFSKE